MNDFFKNLNPLYLFMAFFCILGIVTAAAPSNIIGVIWVFNTLVWVSIAKMNNDAADKWHNNYDEVSKELYKYKNEEKKK